MPSYEGILDIINKNNFEQVVDDRSNLQQKKNLQNENNEINNISKNQIKNTVQIKPKLASLGEEDLEQNANIEIISCFEDLIKISSKKKEVELKYDLEKNVNLIKFTEGKIDISLNENLGKDFVRNLSQKLLEWTKKRWVITLSKQQGQKTFSELQT